jgi:hypothetical protein
MQEVPVLDKKGEPIGEYKFDPSAANTALKLIGNHMAVNAFRGVNGSEKPVDWVVKVVHVNGESG